MKGKVLVISTDDLFKIIGGKFQEFKPLRCGIFPEIEKNARWMKRVRAEENPDFKQFIPYGVIFTPGRRVFWYRRSKRDKEYPERRLQGKISIGVGGHITPSDDSANFITAAMLRELGEEVKFTGAPQITMLGGINDDSNPVSSVHFGLLFLIRIPTENVVIKGKEIAEGGLKSVTELKEIFATAKDVEGWSRIALSYIHA